MKNCKLSLEEINQLFDRFFQKNPHPVKTELTYSNPYTLLIAVLLSARSTDNTVNKATKELFSVSNTPKKMLEIGENQLKSYIKTIGLYNTKAKNIIKLSEIIVNKHQGEIPHTRDGLEELPGIGRKSANVLLNVVFNQPTIGVDTHIFRVANRIKLAIANTPIKVEKILNDVIPNNWKKKAHTWLVLHGRYICLARKPKCNKCIINDICKYKNKNF